jgi:hypothetical protein
LMSAVIYTELPCREVPKSTSASGTVSQRRAAAYGQLRAE